MKSNRQVSVIERYSYRPSPGGKIAGRLQQVAFGNAIAEPDRRLERAVEAVKPRLGGELGQTLMP